ncbi:hypothetical protein ACEWPL_018850 [Roseovarius sp. S1116L3]|uniref:hypothetical protein n=1 Tax=Roseovarius roseus TaxID=3342636 RepID=UPI00372C9F85
MTGQIIAMILLTPFALAFIYAGIHEYLRHRSGDGASYGLVYDETTGTTHISGLAEDEDPYDPDEFDPNDHNWPEGADDDKS